jgi:16S rRNA (cytosine967-C5)-methyltransferase
MALDVRAAAAKAIGDVLAGRSLNQAIAKQIDKVNARDRGLLQQLSFGTVRHQPRLQAILSQLLDKPLRDKDRDVQALLLCGIYQLDSMRTPDHAAVSATVSATKALKKPWARGMANAVLRRYLRERETLTEAMDEAAAASHPAWLFDKIAAQWPAVAQEIIEANNQQPPMTLRVNSALVSRDDYQAALSEHDIESRPGAISPHAIQLSQARDVFELPGFPEGQVSVQDEAAQMAALLMDAAPGDRVLDACSAPGGKTCHILEMHSELAELVAMDVDELRLEKVRENLSRLGLTATVLCGDGAAPPSELARASFDHILVDAPCSASGVIRRHPDVKLLRRESDIASLADQQLQILKGLWPLLKEGGRLIYATCSILDEENSAVVRQFIEQHSCAELEIIEVEWGEAVSCGRQLLPLKEGPDGLFFSRLRKVAP